MKVEFLYFSGCPHDEGFPPHLDARLANHGNQANVHHLELRDGGHAQRLRFLGSPTVRVEGIDVEPSAARRTDFGMQCRLYSMPAGFQGAPPDDLIVEALERSGLPEVSPSS